MTVGNLCVVTDVHFGVCIRSCPVTDVRRWSVSTLVSTNASCTVID